MLAWIPLESSVISAVAYQGNSLFIRFVSGHEYEYYNVARNVYEALIVAESAGQFFNFEIKPRYEYRQIS